MIEITCLENAVNLKHPRRVMKYVLIWCSSGTLTVMVDEHDYELKAGDVITITSGQVHFVKKTNNVKGYLLEFTYAFFCKDDKDIELIFHNGLFCHFAENAVIPVKNKNVMKEQLKLIQQELDNQPYQYLISVHSRVELILVEINRAKVEQGDEIWKPDALFLKFLETVRDNFEHNYPLSHFAKMLRTTELKLNEQAKLHTGRTAQSVIFGLIASEAKRLLTYENLSVKEVAYKLGFNDPFYFSNFFKKHTRSSPKAYQEQYAL
jgi:AraC family transcriptional regulator, transcriptional activator of pobA